LLLGEAVTVPSDAQHIQVTIFETAAAAIEIGKCLRLIFLYRHHSLIEQSLCFFRSSKFRGLTRAKDPKEQS
jgi:hypothetical protein